MWILTYWSLNWVFSWPMLVQMAGRDSARQLNNKISTFKQVFLVTKISTAVFDKHQRGKDLARYTQWRHRRRLAPAWRQQHLIKLGWQPFHQLFCDRMMAAVFLWIPQRWRSSPMQIKITQLQIEMDLINDNKLSSTTKNCMSNNFIFWLTQIETQTSHV